MVQVGKVIGRAVDSNFWKNFVSTKGDAAAKIALVSTITKDAVNCYYYTTQSYNNKKIPEDKRKFVAAMDFVNGVLNVGIQFLLGSIVESKGEQIFDALTKSKFSTEAVEKFRNKLLASSNKKVNLLAESVDLIKNGLKNHQKACKSGFKVLSVLLVTQVFVKRVIVPFIATPLASLAKKQLDKNEAADKSQSTKNDNNEQPKQMPAFIDNTEHKAFKGFETIINSQNSK